MNGNPVGIVLFENVEVLHFCGPFEVFSATRLNEEKRREEPSPFTVSLVAQSVGTIVAGGGMKVSPDYALDSCPEFDILLVPGGWGTRKEMNNLRLLGWIARGLATFACRVQPFLLMARRDLGGVFVCSVVLGWRSASFFTSSRCAFPIT